MNLFDIQIKPFGSHAVLIEWEAKIDKTLLNHIIQFKNHLKDSVFNQHSVSFIPSYHSLTLVFKNEVIYFKKIKSLLDERHRAFQASATFQPCRWTVSVSYTKKHGLDLSWMADHLQLTETEIIHRHTAPVYTVFAIGFLPGFLYLGGLDERIAVPRKATPRLRVPKGAVGIAGLQTGIYPQASPGGWQIIGHTDWVLFDAKRQPPVLVKVGDELKFNAVALPVD